MKETNQFAQGVRSNISVDEALRGVGLEMLMFAEEYIYATKPLNEEAVAHLGSDLYLLATVLGSVIRAHQFLFTKLEVELPSSVGAVRIPNPYFDKRSGSPEDKAAGQSDDSVGEFPF